MEIKTKYSVGRRIVIVNDDIPNHLSGFIGRSGTIKEVDCQDALKTYRIRIEYDKGDRCW